MNGSCEGLAREREGGREEVGGRPPPAAAGNGAADGKGSHRCTAGALPAMRALLPPSANCIVHAVACAGPLCRRSV